MTSKKFQVAATIHDFIDTGLQKENREKGRNKYLKQPIHVRNQAQEQHEPIPATALSWESTKSGFKNVHRRRFTCRF
jgi:hypothetical protein